MANRFLNNITINDEYTLPSVDGDADQIIKTDGTGSLSFVDLSSIEGASANFVYFEVKNETGSTIDKGKGVMAVGTDGNSGHILIDEMIADGSVESKYFLGVLEENIANGGFARVISFGRLDQFNTNGQNGETWADGDILWCDPDSAGDFTITEPDGPNVKIAAAIVLNASTNGKIQVRVQANEGVHDLHDTKITSQVDGDVLVWDNTTGVWFNDSTLNVDYTAGNVGIGTTSPGAKLEVNGTINVNNSGDKIFIADGSNGTFTLGDMAGVSSEAQISGDGVDITLSNYGSPTLTTTGNNRVGIGTINPGVRLHVAGSTGELLRLDDSSASGNPFMSFNQDGTRRSLIQHVDSGNTLSLVSEFGGIRMMTANDGNEVNRFQINNTGRAMFSREGITGSMTASIYDVNITGDTFNDRYLCFFTQDGTNNPRAWLKHSSSAVAQELEFNSVFSTGSGYANFAFRRGTTPIMFLNQSTQRVGIGTETPSYNLDVTGAQGIRVTSATDLPLRVVSTDGTCGIEITDNTHTYYALTTSDDFRIRSATDGNTDRLTIQGATGNVGIGETNPVNKLNVNGDIGYIGVIGQGSIYGNTGNSSYANMQLYNPSTGYSTFNNQSYGYYFNTSGGTKLTLLNNGNVGIGETNPSERLHIADTSATTVLIEDTDTSKASNANLNFKAAGVEIVKMEAILGAANAATGGGLSISTATNNSGGYNNSILTLTNGNRVGVGGLPSPNATLEVNGGVKIGDDTDTANSDKPGTLRYRTSGNNSYVDMCMQTGASTYEWVNIVQNNW